jgi:hypothetical protein
MSFLCHLQGNGNKILRLLFRCGGVDVQTIKQYEKKTVSMALTAAEFKYRHLYGSNIQRESSRYLYNSIYAH